MLLGTFHKMLTFVDATLFFSLLVLAAGCCSCFTGYVLAMAGFVWECGSTSDRYIGHVLSDFQVAFLRQIHVIPLHPISN